MTSSPRAAVEGSRRRGTSPWSLRLPGDRRIVRGSLPAIMAIVNLTPDSFSDGDRFTGAEPAVAAGLDMLRDGADILDLGAASSRPGGGVYGGGADEVSVDEEWHRLGPVLEGLRDLTDAPISVDTRKAEVARRALDAGADLVNDVSCLGDPDMAPLVAQRDVPVVLMHSRGELRTMQRGISFRDVVSEVTAELAAAVEGASEAGIARDQIVVDPGLGFGKTYEQNLTLLAQLPRLGELGLPILVGASRKSFLGKLGGDPAPQRLIPSLAAAAWSAAKGADIVRVHDAAETCALLRVWNAIAGAE